MYVEMHIIQNFAPSCLNRDDTNMPKDCEFGGFTRGRISSQCLKRSIRTSRIFAENLQTAIGVRTRQIPTELLNRLVAAGRPEDKAREIVASFIPEALGKIDATMKSSALVYVSKNEVDQMFEIIQANWDALLSASASAPIADEGEKSSNRRKKSEAAKTALQSLCSQLAKSCELGDISPDIALFGRMMAERPQLNVEGAAQVAHAISTNKVNHEIDFYTAVDDLSADDDAGAGMMGTVAFNSACFYRYSVVNVDQLVSSLGGDRETAVRTIEAFVKANVAAIPTGKQNSMAAHNPPSLVLVTVRRGQPISLTNAFVRPVGNGGKEGDMIGESIGRLDSYLADVMSLYGQEEWAFAGAVVLGEYQLEKATALGLKRFGSFSALFESLRGAIDGNATPAT